jgi:hypothetical protein
MQRNKYDNCPNLISNTVLPKDINFGRRSFIKWAIIGGLIVLPVGTVFYKRQVDTRSRIDNFFLSGTFNKTGCFAPSDFGYQSCKNSISGNNVSFERVVIDSTNDEPLSNGSKRKKIVLQNKISLEFSLSSFETTCISIDAQICDTNGKHLFSKSEVYNLNKEKYMPRRLGTLIRASEAILVFDIIIPDSVPFNECKKIEVKIQSITIKKSTT